MSKLFANYPSPDETDNGKIAYMSLRHIWYKKNRQIAGRGTCLEKLFIVGYNIVVIRTCKGTL